MAKSLHDGPWFAWRPVRINRRNRRDRGRWAWLSEVSRIDIKVPTYGSAQIDGFWGFTSLFRPRIARVYYRVTE